MPALQTKYGLSDDEYGMLYSPGLTNDQLDAKLADYSAKKAQGGGRMPIQTNNSSIDTRQDVWVAASAPPPPPPPPPPPAPAPLPQATPKPAPVAATPQAAPASPAAAAPAPKPAATPSAPPKLSAPSGDDAIGDIGQSAMGGLSAAIASAPTPGWADDSALAQTAGSLGQSVGPQAMSALSQIAQRRGLY